MTVYRPMYGTWLIAFCHIRAYTANLVEYLVFGTVTPTIGKKYQKRRNHSEYFYPFPNHLGCWSTAPPGLNSWTRLWFQGLNNIIRTPRSGNAFITLKDKKCLGVLLKQLIPQSAKVHTSNTLSRTSSILCRRKRVKRRLLGIDLIYEAHSLKMYSQVWWF